MTSTQTTYSSDYIFLAIIPSKNMAFISNYDDSFYDFKKRQKSIDLHPQELYIFKTSNIVTKLRNIRIKLRKYIMYEKYNTMIYKCNKSVIMSIIQNIDVNNISTNLSNMRI